MTTAMIINTDPLQFGMLNKDLKIGRILDVLLFSSAFFVTSHYLGRTDQGVKSL